MKNNPHACWVNLNNSYPAYMINSENGVISVTWYTGMYPYYELRLYCRLYNDDRVYKCVKRVSVLPRWVVDRIKDIPHTETKDKWKWVLKDAK